MIPIMQTKRGGPVPHSDDPEWHWWDATQRALAPLGYCAVITRADVWPDCLWIAAVPSLNLRKPDGTPIPHVVVMRDGEVAHDPGLAKRYAVGTPIEQLEVLDAFVLVPFEVERRDVAA